ncbi:MAG: hypothetical protein IJ795_06695 [Bacteroidales bacterium]|nr:hypothetical protein [Bacteroidales bacterium]
MKKAIITILLAVVSISAVAQNYSRSAEFEVPLAPDILEARLMSAIDYINTGKDVFYPDVLDWKPSFIDGSIHDLVLPIKRRSVRFENIKYTTSITARYPKGGTPVLVINMFAVYPGHFKWYKFPTFESCTILPEHPEKLYRGKKAQALQALVAYMDKQFKRDCDIILRSLEFESDMELE